MKMIRSFPALAAFVLMLISHQPASAGGKDGGKELLSILAERYGVQFQQLPREFADFEWTCSPQNSAPVAGTICRGSIPKKFTLLFLWRKPAYKVSDVHALVLHGMSDQGKNLMLVEGKPKQPTCDSKNFPGGTQIVHCELDLVIGRRNVSFFHFPGGAKAGDLAFTVYLQNIATSDPVAGLFAKVLEARRE